MRNLCCASKCRSKLRGAGHCTSFGRTHDQNLETCCRGISSCQAGDNPKQQSSHRHCYQYLNGANLGLSDLPNDDSFRMQFNVIPGYDVKLHPVQISLQIYCIFPYPRYITQFSTCKQLQVVYILTCCQIHVSSM